MAVGLPIDICIITNSFALPPIVQILYSALFIQPRTSIRSVRRRIEIFLAVTEQLEYIYPSVHPSRN